MNNSIKMFIHTKQLNIHTQPEQPNSVVFIFKLCEKLADFVYFIYLKFCTFHRPPKICTWLAKQFGTFHPSLHESVTWFISFLTKVNLSVPVNCQNLAKF